MFRKPPYYLTAYGLAVREGFKGTLEQWLESLRGEKGDGVELRYQDDKLQWRSVPPEGAQIPEDWEEDEWKDLLELEDIRGPVVEQTLEQAQQAAQEATEAAGEAELMASHAQGHEQMAAQYAQEALEAARFVAVTTEYAVSEDGSTQPKAWETDIPELTAEKPFLWMKVNKNYTDGTAAADVGVIGRYGADGKDGGSTTITLKYGVSSTPSMNTVTGWQDTIPRMSETYPYLWIEISTETITATGGSNTVEAGIIGYYSTPDSGGNANQGTGWTTEQIELLDQLFNYIPFTASEGGTIADNLIASLRGEAVKTLVSISAVYSGGEVVAGTALTALTGIIVTATYDDGSTATVYGYTLSGTIAEGENTITVTYGGKTATFTVTGTASSGGEEEPDTTTYTVTNNLTNVTTSNAASTVKHGGSYSATLSAADGYTLDGANVTVTIGGVDFTSSVYMNGEINIATVSGDIVITATAVADITSVVVEMVANNLARDQVTIYSDEGVTVDEGTYSGSIRNAVVSSMAFSADTQVRVTRKRASEGSTWTTVLIGESDPSDLTKIYNAVVHDNKFVDETIERPHDYTVHAGRKLVVRYYNHLSSGVLVTSSVAPDVPDVPDTPVGSEVAMTYAGSNLHADNGNANAISNFTVYTDEGTTAITYPVEGIDEYLNGRYISDEAFELDTDVTIARSVATAAGWTTIVIGECDTDDESVVYNAVLSDHSFTTPSTEKTYSYTVHAGRKLVMFRRNNNINAYTLTVTK